LSGILWRYAVQRVSQPFSVTFRIALLSEGNLSLGFGTCRSTSNLQVSSGILSLSQLDCTLLGEGLYGWDLLLGPVVQTRILSQAFVIVRPALVLILLLTELAMCLSSTVPRGGVCDSRSRTRGLTARYAPKTDLKLFACNKALI
jgi:hypothetical protein